MFAQRRLKSACASAQSDQSLRCLHEENLHPWLTKMRTDKILIRLCECVIRIFAGRTCPKVRCRSCLWRHKYVLLIGSHTSCGEEAETISRISKEYQWSLPGKDHIYKAWPFRGIDRTDEQQTTREKKTQKNNNKKKQKKKKKKKKRHALFYFIYFIYFLFCFERKDMLWNLQLYVFLLSGTGKFSGATSLSNCFTCLLKRGLTLRGKIKATYIKNKFHDMSQCHE